MQKKENQTNGAERRLATTSEVANFARTSIRTVQNWRLEGLPCLRISARCLRFDLAEVEKWMRQR
jgi:phage terminase Nu1 subunit (DNA packaging protein)